MTGAETSWSSVVLLAAMGASRLQPTSRVGWLVRRLGCRNAINLAAWPGDEDDSVGGKTRGV